MLLSGTNYSEPCLPNVQLGRVCIEHSQACSAQQPCACVVRVAGALPWQASSTGLSMAEFVLRNEMTRMDDAKIQLNALVLEHPVATGGKRRGQREADRERRGGGGWCVNVRACVRV